jgi:hypothetical protein
MKLADVGPWETASAAVPVAPGQTVSWSVTWGSSNEYFTFDVQSANVPIDTPPVSVANWTLVPTSPTTVTFNPNVDVFSLIEHHPDWDGLKNAARSMRVVAQDCLVTFEGSTLADNGSIAVCNSDEPLIFNSSPYNSIASFPFDRYRGRLASKGETEGGGHWHYVPSDARQLLLQDIDESPTNLPTGYFGIAGCDPLQPIKVEMNIVVNFYTLDPSYPMKIRPALDDFIELLYMLRKEVPLCSSNDGHLKKVVNFARKKVSELLQGGLDNPQHVAKALSTMLTLL